jgi:hypothetical protein
MSDSNYVGDNFEYKTVKKVLIGFDSISIFFSDTTYTHIYATAVCDNCGSEKSCDTSIEFGPAQNYTLARLGVITEEECQKRTKAEREKEEAVKEEKERKELERLMAKYPKMGEINE